MSATAKIFTWDWRQQPDMEAIAATVNALSGGTVHMTAIDTGTDEYGWIVSDKPITEAETKRLWRLYQATS